jgi:hypothetical protein
MDAILCSDDVQRGGGEKLTGWKRKIGRCAGLLALAASVCVGGCAAEVAPAPVAPSSYYDYPYTYYDGHIVYYVNGYWYYPHGERWYYYRSVPPGLAQRSRELHYDRGPYYRAQPYARPPYSPPRTVPPPTTAPPVTAQTPYRRPNDRAAPYSAPYRAPATTQTPYRRPPYGHGGGPRPVDRHPR